MPLRHCSSTHHHQSIEATVPDTMAAASTTFSLFFPLHNNKAEFAHVAMAADGFDDDSHSSVTTSPSSPSSSAGSVDCTLSLGTPSSRRAAAETAKQRLASSCGAVSWDVVSWDVAAAGAADHQSYCCCCCFQGGSRPSTAAAAMDKTAAVPCAGQDPMLVDRRCANCGTSSTPLWRNGPRGPKSLCNACGIRFKKEERRAAATATTAAAMDQGGGCGYFAQRAQYGGAAVAVAAPAVTYGSCEAPVFPYGCGDVADAEAVPPQFLAWRFDVVAPPAPAAAFAAVWPERTTLFQYN